MATRLHFCRWARRPLWAPRRLSPHSVRTILHYCKTKYAHRFKIAARSNRCTLVARSASASSRSQAARPSPLPLVASRLDRGFRARVVATGCCLVNSRSKPLVRWTFLHLYIADVTDAHLLLLPPPLCRGFRPLLSTRVVAPVDLIPLLAVPRPDQWPPGSADCVQVLRRRRRAACNFRALATGQHGVGT
jgi:hypothetical protein